MTEPNQTPGPSDQLQRVNLELADIFDTQPAQLAFGADAALEDHLVVCGILGGKGVGKSTLINALAKRKVSVETGGAGRGTERPMAYVHKAMQEVVAQRLRSTGRQVPLDITSHDAEPIRNAVLVDLPDFDSEFMDHLDVVRAVAPLLDRVVWVVTPRKIGDRIWVEMLDSVIKDPSNVYCVLNKVDELLSDSDPFEKTTGGRGDAPTTGAQSFWEGQYRWVTRSFDAASPLAGSQSGERRFLVAAAFPDPDRFVSRIGELWNDPDWNKYTADRSTAVEISRLACEDLQRLRSCVLGPVSAENSRTVKAINRAREQEANIARIESHYDLDRTVERLARACDPDYLQRVLNEAMGPDYCAAVATAVRAQLRPDTGLADELLERRVEHWPLLRLVHWPFGWLSRLLAKGYGLQAPRSETRPGGHGVSEGVGSLFDMEGRSPGDRIALMRSRILADQAVIARQLQMEAALPEAADLTRKVVEAIRALPPRLEADLIEQLRQLDRKPLFLAKVALWFILLWFPLLQPILAGSLEMFSDTGTVEFARGLYRIVSALSAVHLLASFAVVAGIFVVILAGMYVRSLRAVRRASDEQSVSSSAAEAFDEILISEVVVPLARPFQKQLNRIQTALRRLRNLRNWEVRTQGD
ncbi:MAG: GTPase domain-containing protein [Phycisphaerales bacterium]|nr:MAG: GTPase domain-containing protein [Phycisphaerales bacterium]